MKAVMWGCFKAAEAVRRAARAGSWSIQLLSTSPCLSTPLFQAYFPRLSCWLLLSSFGSKWTAFIHTCHITQQYCTEWASLLRAVSGAMRSYAHLCFSLRERESRAARLCRGNGRSRVASETPLFPILSQTYCFFPSPWSSDGRGCRTAVVCFITSQNSWGWQDLWVHPEELGSSQEMLRNGPLLMQPLLCCSFQPLQLFLSSVCLSGCAEGRGTQHLTLRGVAASSPASSISQCCVMLVLCQSFGRIFETY